MNCKETIVELVECARGDVQPNRELRTHLAICGHCSERWEAEKQLTAEFGMIRKQAEAVGSPVRRRDAIMREFSQVHARKSIPISRGRAWVWALGAAAALLLAVAIGHEAGKRNPAPGSHAAQILDEVSERAVLYEASNALSTDASAFSNDDFVAVPYTPPLALGELVRIVRTQMYPEALASMGVEVDPSSVDLPVEIVVGEDGIPRAVRITDNSQF